MILFSYHIVCYLYFSKDRKMALIQMESLEEAVAALIVSMSLYIFSLKINTPIPSRKYVLRPYSKTIFSPIF